MTDLHVTEWGAGEAVIFVHGSLANWGEKAFANQRELADRYKLLLVDRRGFGDSPPVPNSEDWAADAKDIADLIGAGAHLVGHSGGGSVCLLAASLRPEAVRSLTIIEAPAFSAARGDAAVENFIQRHRPVFARAIQRTPEESVADVAEAFGFERPTALPAYSEKEIKGIRTGMRGHPPWEGSIPVGRLASARFPKLVVSGGWKNEPPLAQAVGGRAFNVTCDALAQQVGAERVVFEEASHSPHDETPQLFNARLRAFLASASPTSSSSNPP